MPNRDELLYLNCELKIANAERLVRNSQLIRSQLPLFATRNYSIRNSKSSQLATTQFATPKVRNSKLFHSQLPTFETRNYSIRNSQRSQLETIPFATTNVRNSQLIRSQPPKFVKSKFFFIFLFFPKLNHTIITYENS
jgi:hypothetical protein